MTVKELLSFEPGPLALQSSKVPLHATIRFTIIHVFLLLAPYVLQCCWDGIHCYWIGADHLRKGSGSWRKGDRSLGEGA